MKTGPGSGSIKVEEFLKCKDKEVIETEIKSRLYLLCQKLRKLSLRPIIVLSYNIAEKHGEIKVDCSDKIPPAGYSSGVPEAKPATKPNVNIVVVENAEV